MEEEEFIFDQEKSQKENEQSQNDSNPSLITNNADIFSKNYLPFCIDAELFQQEKFLPFVTNSSTTEFGSPSKRAPNSILNIHISSKQPKRPKKYPQELEDVPVGSNDFFIQCLEDKTLTFSSVEYNFYPAKFFAKETFTFEKLIRTFFQVKSNSHAKFPYKLHNALSITEKRPELYPIIGVIWVTDYIFKIDKYIFARLLGIIAIDGSFFHKQGCFRIHEFVDLTENEIDLLNANEQVLSDVDQKRVHLMRHRPNQFLKDTKEDEIIF
ncbi:hypothetical protein GPJ56_004501 [Histomonas meleagridis]|uniref:uncharacterized protein n=1 Tax=Histomonas meleagridis TaxID=135588 RepID=UPI003559CA0F|nr:hypothetical protein GPJ56_004501 [Histomonas meleagridis]KAH0803601.1 hypothetical protein GO595_003566 [Histomonas meleagridis]